MCTRIRFLGWAPGSRVPSQAPTIGGSAARDNAGISVNPNQSPSDNARSLFMVDLLMELAAESASAGDWFAPWRPGYHKHTPALSRPGCGGRSGGRGGLNER